VVRSVTVMAAILLALGAGCLSAAPERPAAVALPRVLQAFGKTCEAQRVRPASEFQRRVLDQERKRAAWAIVLRSPERDVRRAHAEQIARAAQGTLHVVEPEAVAKAIGETAKTLDTLFEAAEQQDWILFFDEADALFGKRTEVQDAHDRYGNQEVAALLDSLSKRRALVVFGTRSTSAIDPDLLARLTDAVVTAKPRKPGPVPPAPWSAVCAVGSNPAP